MNEEFLEKANKILCDHHVYGLNAIINMEKSLYTTAELRIFFSNLCIKADQLINDSYVTIPFKIFYKSTTQDKKYILLDEIIREFNIRGVRIEGIE